MDLFLALHLLFKESAKRHLVLVKASTQQQQPSLVPSIRSRANSDSDVWPATPSSLVAAMDAISQTDDSSAYVLRIADLAYQNVNRLNELLRYWSSAPSEVCRLRDATAKLHDLLNSFWRARRDDNEFDLRTRSQLETLASDMKFAMNALGQLSRILDFVCNPDVLDKLRHSKSTVRIKSRWSMRRESICVLQGQLDESSRQLLARLIESNV